MTSPITPSEPSPELSSPFFGIQRIFLKGVSLELPLGASVFLKKGTPALSLTLQVGVEVLAPDVFQCAIRATVSSTLEDATLFLLEVDQAGVFEARGLDPAQLADVQQIAAPTILAPYLRAQLADALTRATLPSFYLPEINWSQMAMQSRLDQAQSGAVAPAAPVTLH